ncbi:LOW QUALITY PROTEIN: DDE_4 domain-containing protein, partial [Cephalotus follicularis]
YVGRIIFDNDLACYDKVCMDRRAFHILCQMLKSKGKLSDNKNSSVEDMVAMFLFMLGHHTKHRVIKTDFVRSWETVSIQFNAVLNDVLMLQKELLKKPEQILENSNNSRWKWFKNCLGALDGTYIHVNALNYITTNVLGVSSQDMQFIYILPGWEGSAADSRVLRDAISRNGLRVPQGHCYLCDASYSNVQGFLVPYRGQRYHLIEFRHGPNPNTHEEFFNMKHSAARNVIERTFGLLKGRWAILRSRTWYPVKTQCRIIFACALLHNHIRRVMAVDPLEAELREIESTPDNDIRYVKTSDTWTTWRDDLVREMWDRWRS